MSDEQAPTPTPNLKEIEGPSAREEKYGKVVVTKDGVAEDMLTGSEEDSTSESSEDDTDKEQGIMRRLHDETSPHISRFFKISKIACSKTRSNIIFFIPFYHERVIEGLDIAK